MTYRLDSCTGITIGQISGNCFSHSWPPVVSADEFIGGGSSWVSSSKVIMVCMQDFSVQDFVVRDVE